MKSSAKSSITLAADELRLMLALQAKLKARSKVEVVRRGLRPHGTSFTVPFEPARISTTID
jgi:hypothetical protein